VRISGFFFACLKTRQPQANEKPGAFLHLREVDAIAETHGSQSGFKVITGNEKTGKVFEMHRIVRQSCAWKTLHKPAARTLV